MKCLFRHRVLRASGEIKRERKNPPRNQARRAVLSQFGLA
jgi:hypothetical protein